MWVLGEGLAVPESVVLSPGLCTDPRPFEGSAGAVSTSTRGNTWQNTVVGKFLRPEPPCACLQEGQAPLGKMGSGKGLGSLHKAWRSLLGRAPLEGGMGVFGAGRGARAVLLPGHE